MKRCPKCNQTYSDDELNFCLNDGEMLMQESSSASSRPYDDPPPTVMMNEPRVTNPSNWPQSSPPATWQSPQPAYQQPAGFGNYPMTVAPSQTLAAVSLGLGIGGMTIGWCCSLALVLSPAALITGLIALSQNKKNPQTYGGRGLAIGGVVLGSISLAAYLLFILIYGAAVIFGGLSGH